ncbi:hypothetical protein M5K25_014536 [Dendrobium thyrsiflorum]|uniref:Uncharacterized protein n=1 Tax=Dendrobium thyrsiflorum TaxID=117978 RepID=A0ABD0UWE4_DENTH
MKVAGFPSESLACSSPIRSLDLKALARPGPFSRFFEPLFPSISLPSNKTRNPHYLPSVLSSVADPDGRIPSPSLSLWLPFAQPGEASFPFSPSLSLLARARLSAPAPDASLSLVRIFPVHQTETESAHPDDLQPE